MHYTALYTSQKLRPRRTRNLKRHFPTSAMTHAACIHMSHDHLLRRLLTFDLRFDACLQVQFNIKYSRVSGRSQLTGQECSTTQADVGSSHVPIVVEMIRGSLNLVFLLVVGFVIRILGSATPRGGGDEIPRINRQSRMGSI